MPDEGDCSRCGQTLLRLGWNSVTDMIVCDNYECELFRTPIGSPKPLEKTKSQLEIPDWLRGTNGSESNKISSRLQKLQQVFYSKKEDTEIL